MELVVQNFSSHDVEHVETSLASLCRGHCHEPCLHVESGISSHCRIIGVLL